MICNFANEISCAFEEISVNCKVIIIIIVVVVVVIYPHRGPVSSFI